MISVFKNTLFVLVVVSVFSFTEATVPETCGGVADLPCSSGFTCIHDPRIDCDLSRGGIDCSGICVGGCDVPADEMACTEEYMPVCGSDGTEVATFGNLCAFNAAFCKSDGALTIRSFGECSHRPGMKRKRVQPNMRRKSVQPNMRRKSVQPNMRRKSVHQNEKRSVQLKESDMEHKRANPSVMQKRVNPSVMQKRVNPSVKQKRLNPSLKQKRLNPSLKQEPAHPNIRDSAHLKGVVSKPIHPGERRVLLKKEHARDALRQKRDLKLKGDPNHPPDCLEQCDMTCVHDPEPDCEMPEIGDVCPGLCVGCPHPEGVPNGTMCHAQWKPVCSSDGHTHSNLCLFNIYMCTHSEAMLVSCKHSEQDPLPDDFEPGELVPPPRFCTAEYSPVCGSDGMIYHNHCSMLRSSSGAFQVDWDKCKGGIHAEHPPPPPHVILFSVCAIVITSLAIGATCLFCYRKIKTSVDSRHNCGEEPGSYVDMQGVRNF